MSLFDSFNTYQAPQQRVKRQQNPGLPKMDHMPASRGMEAYSGIADMPTLPVASEDVMDYGKSQTVDVKPVPHTQAIFDEQLGRAQAQMAAALRTNEGATAEAIAATEALVDNTSMSWESQSAPDSVDTSIPVMAEYGYLNPNAVIRQNPSDQKRNQKYNGSKTDPWSKGRLRELPNKNKGEDAGYFTGQSQISFATGVSNQANDQSDIVEESSKREGAFLLGLVLVGCVFFLYRNYR
jgi:hypothetical protein